MIRATGIIGWGILFAFVLAWVITRFEFKRFGLLKAFVKWLAIVILSVWFAYCMIVTLVDLVHGKL